MRAEKIEVKQEFASGVHPLNPWKRRSHLQSDEGDELEDDIFY